MGLMTSRLKPYIIIKQKYINMLIIMISVTNMLVDNSKTC